MPSSVPSPELLLERVRCVTALARALAREPASGEDVAQDALLHSLQRVESEREPMPGWLARKVRSLSRRARRAAGRRVRRETVAARPEAVPSAAELVERAWLQRSLVEAVVGLDEPYRSVVLLRYFEELPPREIASMRATPVRTIQTQLSRALAQLRARLDGKLGPGTWAVLAAPLGSRAPIQALKPVALSQASTPLALAAGGILVKTQLKIAAGVGVVLLVGGLALVLAPGRRPTVPSTGSDEVGFAPAGATLNELPQPTLELSGVQSEDRDERSPAETETSERPDFSLTDPIDRERDLFGVVVDPSGQPVRAAAVSVQLEDSHGAPLFPDELDEEPVARTSTDADGRFRLRLEPGPQYRLVVEHSAYATARLPERFAGEQVRVVLGAAARLFGRVVRDGDESAIPGASVLLIDRAEGSVARPEKYSNDTDALGEFKIGGLPAGTYDIIVRCPADPDVWGRSLTLAAGQTLEHAVRVPTGITVSGHVYDSATRTAIQGAEVGRSWFFSGTVRTDVDGHFELPGLNPEEDNKTVAARAPGYATVEFDMRKGREFAEDLQLFLEPELRAVGRVLDPSGRPIDAARVEAYGRPYDPSAVTSGGLDFAQAFTGPDGRFELGGLSRRARHSLVVHSRGAASLVVDFPDTERELGAVELGDLALFAPASLGGRVVDQEGRPIPRACVHFEGGDRGRNRMSLAPSPAVDTYTTRLERRVDDLGRFSATDLGPGTYYLSAVCPGLVDSAQTSLVLREGERRDGVELVLDVGTAEGVIAGRVVDPDGAPVAGIDVESSQRGDLRADRPPRRAGMRTRSDGSFRLEGLTPGLHDLEAVPWAFDEGNLCPTRIEGISTGSLDVVLELPWRATIRGQVVGADGAPTEWCMVQIDYAAETYGGLLAVATDVQGRFELPVPAGEHVDVVAFDYAVKKVGRARNVAAGTEGLVIRLDP
jgi:RNA polymerase sigma factor (sigma-70 family)